MYLSAPCPQFRTFDVTNVYDLRLIKQQNNFNERILHYQLQQDTIYTCI